MGGDLGYISDLGVRNGVGMFTKIPGLYGDVQSAFATGDMFSAGKAFGKLWKMMFDFNLGN